MPTQIQFKRGTTTPTGLTVGEPAFDTVTSRLFIGNTAAVRWMGGEITSGVDMGAGSAASQNRVPTQNAVYEYARRNFVASFNGNTGAVQGVSAAIAGTGISVSGATGAVTITNIGVQSFNGLTGAVGGVTTSAANTFTAVQTFNSGVTFASTTDHTGNARFVGGINVTSSVGITSSGPLTVTHNITQTGPTRGLSAEGFLYVGGGATFNTSIAVPRIVNPGSTLTVQSGVAAGTARNIHLNPYGQVILEPLPTLSSGGSTPKIVVQNTDGGVGQIQMSGGDLYLGTALDSEATILPTGILFANANNAFTTSLSAPDAATSSKLITLPNASGVVALTNSVVTSFNGLTGAVTGVTVGGANTFTRLNTFNAGLCAAGGFTLSSGRINFTSASVTIAPFTINAASLNDGVGAIRINSTEPDINLNDTDGGFSTFTFENNNVARVALGRNSIDQFYLAVRDPSVSGGAWKDNVIVADSSTGNVGMGYNLGVTGNISASGTVTASNLVYGINGITGGITLNAGTNVTITSSVAGGITIAASGGGGGGDGVTSFNGLTGAVTGTSVARHWFI